MTFQLPFEAGRKLRVIVACESSGKVREAFRRRGHDAWSCDLLPADDGSPYHLQGDALEHVYGQPWDVLIGHPPCTFLTVAAAWCMMPEVADRFPERAEKQRKAIEFALALWDAPVERICIENPVSVLSSSRMGEPAQTIQPYEYGHDASKRTCLWLKNLPCIPVPPRSRWHPPRYVMHEGKRVARWSNQTDGGHNALSPSPDRWKERSKTFDGIADAMAETWG